MMRLMALGEQERQAMGLAGRELVAGAFDVTAIASSWASLYVTLLERRRAGQGARFTPG